jgi:CheY-like chemotaxis protein
MPVMNGLEAAPFLIKILPHVWLILFTAHNGPEVDRLSRAAGIHAVVPKSNSCNPLDRRGGSPGGASGLAGILPLALVFSELNPETLLRIRNPLQGSHRNVK